MLGCTATLYANVLKVQCHAVHYLYFWGSHRHHANVRALSVYVHVQVVMIWCTSVNKKLASTSSRYMYIDNNLWYMYMYMCRYKVVVWPTHTISFEPS